MQSMDPQAIVYLLHHVDSHDWRHTWGRFWSYLVIFYYIIYIYLLHFLHPSIHPSIHPSSYILQSYNVMFFSQPHGIILMRIRMALECFINEPTWKQKEMTQKERKRERRERERGCVGRGRERWCSRGRTAKKGTGRCRHTHDTYWDMHERYASTYTVCMFQ